MRATKKGVFQKGIYKKCFWSHCWVNSSFSCSISQKTRTVSLTVEKLNIFSKANKLVPSF